MKKLLSILFIVVLITVTTACGKNMIGTYKLLEMESSGQKFTAKELETLGIKMELVIKDNEKAVFSIDGDSQELTYNDKEFIAKNVETNESRSYSYQFDGNKIIMEKDGEKLTFQK